MSPQRSAGRNRTEEIKIRHRRLQVSRLYLQGIPQYEIAEALDVDPAQVCRDLKAMQAEWAAKCHEAIDVRRAEEIARIDEIERTAREAWERSCKDAETLHVKREQTAEGEKTTSEKTTKGQYGDPRFLERLAWCVSERLKIVGGYAATKLEHAGKDGGPIQAQIEVTEVVITKTSNAEPVQD